MAKTEVSSVSKPRSDEVIYLPRSMKEFHEVRNKYLPEFKALILETQKLPRLRLHQRIYTSTTPGIIYWFSWLGSLRNGRPLGSTVILVTGSKSSGKSSIINTMYGGDIVPVNEDGTEIVTLRQEWRIPCEGKFIKGNLLLLEVPDFFENNQRYQKQFARQLSDLPDLNKGSSLKELRAYPNAVLFVINLSEEQFGCENSNFVNKLQKLKDFNVIDPSNNNLIIILTNVLKLSKDQNEVRLNIIEVTRVIKMVVWRVLTILDVTVVPMENGKVNDPICIDSIDCVIDGGDENIKYFQRQLAQCMKDVGDNLGDLVISNYKPFKVETSMYSRIPCNISSFSQSLRDMFSANEIITSWFSNTFGRTRKMLSDSIGNGYCPVTNAKIVIHEPFAANPYYLQQNRESDLDKHSFIKRITTVSKAEYDMRRANELNLDSDMQLNVTNSEGVLWMYPNKGSRRCIRFSLELELYAMEIRNIHDIKFTNEFSDAFKNLPSEYSRDTWEAIFDFFRTWGTHVVTFQGYGGVVYWNYSFDDEGKSVSREIQEAFSSSYKSEILRGLKRFLNLGAWGAFDRVPLLPPNVSVSTVIKEREILLDNKKDVFSWKYGVADAPEEIEYRKRIVQSINVQWTIIFVQWFFPLLSSIFLICPLDKNGQS